MSLPRSSLRPNSLLDVTDLDPHPVTDAGTELSAQIKARVLQRRGSSDRARHQVSVAELRVVHLQSTSATRAETRAAERAAQEARELRRGRGGKHGVPPKKRGLVARGARLAVLLVLTLLAVIGLRAFVIASYYIPSASMETTLHGCQGCQPDMVLVDKLSYRFSAIGRKDVVVFNRPPLAPPEDKQLIKRVIGLPGDTVSGRDGHVFVNDQELNEPYVNPACHGTTDFAPVTVPAGRYFMMGDNRCDSFDSRMFGTIARSAIVGRAFAVMWPVKHLRWL